MPSDAHRWTFFRAGGVDQVALARAEDIANLRSLDQKLWVALACPVNGVEIDPRTLTLLDTDKDGRIRPPEVLAAIDWLKDVLEDLGDLLHPSDEIELTSISGRSATSGDILAGAKLVLRNLGKPDAKTISLADVSSTEAIFSATRLNGDGIVPPESADDPETAALIGDIAAVLGTVTDRSGKPGVDQPRVDAFFDQVAAYAAWFDAKGTSSIDGLSADATQPAVDALAAVRAKVEDFFTRCRLASFDPRAVAALNPSDATLGALSTGELSARSDDVARLPLARIEPGRALPLADDLNPAWAARMGDFARLTVAPVLGGSRAWITEHDWDTITQRLATYSAWASARPAADVLKLGHDRILALARSDARARVTDLVTRDAALSTEAGQIDALEKLLRCRRDFLALLRNFVNFSAFYGKREGIFQTGTLYIDARSCDLCLPVDDPPRHALLASLSQAYLAYCECVRRGAPDKDKEKRSIVAVVTGGDTDNLLVGRNGVFYDRAGHDWDATITKIVDNPISVRQAFWSPYKRFIRLVEEQLTKRAKAADDEGNKKIEASAVDVSHADKTPEKKDDDAKKDEKDAKDGKDGTDAKDAKSAPKDAAPKPGDRGEKGIDVGTVAAIGVAVGGIATFFSSVIATFAGMGMWMPFGLVALLLAVSGPSMLVAWLKLRQRNIGPILDANGWAVNAVARINVPFGAALTSLATLPAGASRSLRDPFAEKKRPWRFYGFLAAVVLLALAWFFGSLDTYLPERVRVVTVLHRTPVTQPAPAASH
jgi:hypothetical protein